ncbi:MAG: hypothetical protein JWM41_282 [Gemmatimonadetes bacterium]|nr:hypothetical protein [Gemmatimonadota bacterium]
MWSVISGLLVRIAALRWLFKLGGLGLLVPIAFLLKVVGLPLLAILSVLALPVLVLLFLFGLPIFMVLIVGGMLMGLLGVVLAVGIVAIKIGLFVVLPIWLVWKLTSRVFRWGCKRRGTGTDTSSTDTSSSDTTDSSTDSSSGPATGFEPA